MGIRIGNKELTNLVVGTSSGNKEILEVWQGTSTGNKLVWSLSPYVLATDDDFSGTADGEFKYIGSHEYVLIPHVIKGVNVTSYRDMFTDSKATLKGVASDNPNITDMSGMFADNEITTLDLSNFDTSNVTDMSYMFSGCQVTTLDLSNFDTSKVTDMSSMFQNSAATTGYARTQADADKFNASTDKPAGLTFYINPELFGAPTLTEQGAFLDRWTASGTGTGVGQVYDDMLYLSVGPNESTGDSALFLSDPVKVSSDAFSWQMTARDALGGQNQGTYWNDRYTHGIPIGTIIKIGITLTCMQPKIVNPPIFIDALSKLDLSIVNEDGEPLVDLSILDGRPVQIVSIDSLKFT